MTASLCLITVYLSGGSDASAAQTPTTDAQTTVGRPLAPTKSEAPRQGERRVYAGRATAQVESSNWSGLAKTGSGIEGAEGYWTVPAVQPSGSNLYSATWVGVDGWGSDELIQTGTAQDTGDGYSAWYEILPQDPTSHLLNDAPVYPGDSMFGRVVATSTPGTWTIFLEDNTQGWYFQQNFSYSGPEQSAEWIEEAPTVGGTQQQSIADFGSVQFTQTAMYGDLGSSGATWYGTDMNASNEVDLVNDDNVLLAAPSAPSTDSKGGQDFVDTYEGSTPPGAATAPSVSVSSPHNRFQLTTRVHVRYSASDASSPVDAFDVRYTVAPWSREHESGYQYPGGWQDTTTTSQDLDGTPGSTYCFDVRAASEGGAMSPWTSDECATLPLGEASLSAVAPREWRRERATAVYQSSYATSTVDGAMLRVSGVWANQVAVVAARCPSCGLVDVFVDGRLLGHIDTYGRQMEGNRIYLLPDFAFGRVTVVLRCASAHKRVIIEGLGIA